jgi:hypothetical protein
LVNGTKQIEATQKLRVAAVYEMAANDSPRPNFTGRLLAWWIAVAAINEGLVHATNLSIEYMARDWDDRTGVATLFVLVIVNTLLVPALATTQWLVLRRGWPGIWWGQWLAVSAVTAFTTGIVWWWLPLPRISLRLRFLITVICSGVAAAVAAGFAAR